jgi:hypothetical protein
MIKLSGNTDMGDVPYILTADETALLLDVLYFAADVYSTCTAAASDFAKVKRFQGLADKIARCNRILIE